MIARYAQEIIQARVGTASRYQRGFSASSAPLRFKAAPKTYKAKVNPPLTG